MDDYRFFVPGIPRPGGSKKGFYIKKINRVVVTEDCTRSKDWRNSVAWAASEAIETPLDGPLEVHFTFLLTRPKNHFGARGLKASAPAYPTVKPDTTKLIRSTEDAMKGIAWNDDAQIARQFAEKIYADRAGCWIEIRRLVGTGDKAKTSCPIAVNPDWIAAQMGLRWL
jgi:Holliday junction resolvase RusA-like endonuclease